MLIDKVLGFFTLGLLKVKLILENVINVNTLGISCFMGSVWVFVNALLSIMF